jgi:hypothetical protein
MRLLGSDFPHRLAELFNSASGEIVISTPYFSDAGNDLLVKNARDHFRINGTLIFLTNLSPKNILQSATDPKSLLKLTDKITRTSLRHLPRLHAKAYVADSRVAIITSANLTAGGLYRNFEYGVEIDDRDTVRRIRDDIVAYSELGAVLDRTHLESYCSAAAEMRETYQRRQASLSSEFARKIRVAENNLIRIQLAGGTMTSAFERTITYLLRTHGSMRTVELHPKVAEIHPDLCDDTIDRVINGVHHGKKWKHAVRTAQSHLKANGIVTFDGRLWSLRQKD